MILWSVGRGPPSTSLCAMHDRCGRWYEPGAYSFPGGTWAWRLLECAESAFAGAGARQPFRMRAKAELMLDRHVAKGLVAGVDEAIKGEDIIRVVKSANRVYGDEDGEALRLFLLGSKGDRSTKSCIGLVILRRSESSAEIWWAIGRVMGTARPSEMVWHL